MAGVAPIVWTAKKNALADWVADQLAGVGAHWAKQDAPAPAYPYALLDIIAGPTRVHQDRRQGIDQGNGYVKEYVLGDRTLTVSVEVLVSFEGQTHDHESDAFARAALLQSSLGRDDVLEQFFGAVGLGVLEVGSVQDRRTPVDAGWLQRAGFDVTLHLVSQIDPGSVPAIETVEITGDMGSAGDFERFEFGLPSLAMRFYGETHIVTPAGSAPGMGVFGKIAGTFAAGDLKEFDSPVNGRLRYIGTENRRHKIDIVGTLTSTGGANVKVGISRNGAAPLTDEQVEVKTSVEKSAVAVSAVVELAPQDYIEAWGTLDSAGTFTAEKLKITAIA